METGKLLHERKSLCELSSPEGFTNVHLKQFLQSTFGKSEYAPDIVSCNEYNLW